MFQRKKFANGFEYIELSNASMCAKIALQGAHIFEYKSHSGEDVLWLSPTSDFAYGKAIRGGIPICWPRFGNSDKSMPAHGFSRTALFAFEGVEVLNEHTLQAKFFLEDSQESRKIWDYSFRVEVIFTLGEHLEVEILTNNCDTKEFLLTQALHTYLSVSEIQNIRIEGLESKEYLDTLTNTKHTEATPITINAECDRVYQGVDKPITLRDKSRSVTLYTEGSASAIVWNPWVEKGSRMSGMRADAYREFVCIESANAFEDFRVLQPNASHSLKVKI